MTPRCRLSVCVLVTVLCSSVALADNAITKTFGLNGKTVGGYASIYNADGSQAVLTLTPVTVYGQEYYDVQWSVQDNQARTYAYVWGFIRPDAVSVVPPNGLSFAFDISSLDVLNACYGLKILDDGSFGDVFYPTSVPVKGTITSPRTDVNYSHTTGTQESVIVGLGCKMTAQTSGTIDVRENARFVGSIGSLQTTAGTNSEQYLYAYFRVQTGQVKTTLVCRTRP